MTLIATASPARRLDRVAGYAVWIVLALMLVIAGLLSEAFLRPAYLLNLLRQAAPVGITAAGVTFVMIAGGVDLSVGAVISAAAVLSAVIMDGRPEMMAPALAATSMARSPPLAGSRLSSSRSGRRRRSTASPLCCRAVPPRARSRRAFARS